MGYDLPKRADPALLNGVCQTPIQGKVGWERGLAMVAHKGQRIDHAAVVPDLEMHVRPG